MKRHFQEISRGRVPALAQTTPGDGTDGGTDNTGDGQGVESTIPLINTLAYKLVMVEMAVEFGFFTFRNLMRHGAL